jgi:hypothetical protein
MPESVGSAFSPFMSAVLGLALLASPFVALPMPAHGEPTLIALAADQARRRTYCFSTRCNDEEWRRVLSPSKNAADIYQKARRRPPALPGSRRVVGLRAPARSRESRANYSNRWRIGTHYGLKVLRDGPTQLGLQFGAGYRLAPLRDDGVRVPGPVFRGELNLGQDLGTRARWTQRIFFETGQGESFVKQSLGLDVELWPAWTLETDYVIRHNSTGASGSETAESWLGIRRRF